MWAFLAPTPPLLGVFLYGPMIGTIRDSFYDTSFVSPEPEFVGLELYADVLGGRDFPAVLWNSVAWTLGVGVLQNILGFGAALLLNQALPMRGLTRAIVPMPFVLPGVVTAILCRFMYDPRLGFVNSLAIRIGVLGENAAWLASADTAMAAVIFVAVWKGFAFSLLFQPRRAPERGPLPDRGRHRRRGGADPAPDRRHHPLDPRGDRGQCRAHRDPDLRLPRHVWVMTRGGPQNATHIFPTQIFETGLGQFRFGEAAVYGTASIAVPALLVALYAIVQAGTSRRPSA
jgi:multiple sugar transport system permease protein